MNSEKFRYILTDAKDKLTDAKDIIRKEKEINPQEKLVESKFNPISCIGIEEKEIYICRMLASIIDPHGVHGCGTTFLKIFLEEICGKKVNKEDLEEYEIITEYSVPVNEKGENTNRRIDLVIRKNTDFIPFEVKINAGDLTNQLNDYLSYTEKQVKYTNGVFIYYLTLDGHVPNNVSLSKENKRKVVCISFKNDIIIFLKKCIETSRKLQNSHTEIILTDFLYVIYKISGGFYMDDNIAEKIAKEMITKKEDVEAVLYLNYALYCYKKDRMEKLFDQISDKLQKKFNSNHFLKNCPVLCNAYKDKVFFDHKTSVSEYFLHGNVWPKITLFLKEWKVGDNVYYIGLTFEVEKFPYFGILIAEKNPNDLFTNGNAAKNISKKFQDKLDKLLDLLNLASNDLNISTWWLTWHHVSDYNRIVQKGKFNFRDFNEDAVKLFANNSEDNGVGNKTLSKFVDNVIENFTKTYCEINWDRLNREDGFLDLIKDNGSTSPRIIDMSDIDMSDLD